MKPPTPHDVLARMQMGIESLYRVTTNLDVRSFLVDEAGRGRALALPHARDGARRPPEQLLVTSTGDEVRIGLFLDATVIASLGDSDPQLGLDDGNFWDFCLAVEGISHFIYVALCAASDRSVTALELELQAEVDKFVTCLLIEDNHPQRADALRRRLFERTRLADDLDAHERTRYRTAHEAAHIYVQSLDRRFLRQARTTDMLCELRRFYRMGLPAKLEHIGQAS